MDFKTSRCKLILQPQFFILVLVLWHRRMEFLLQLSNGISKMLGIPWEWLFAVHLNQRLLCSFCCWHALGKRDLILDRNTLAELSFLQDRDCFLPNVCYNAQKMCNISQSKGKQMLTWTTTLFPNTNKDYYADYGYPSSHAHLDSFQICFICTYVCIKCLNPLPFTFKTSHRPDEGCSSAL